MPFTIELYAQGTAEPVAVIHECTPYDNAPNAEIRNGAPVVRANDADGKNIIAIGFNAILREE